MIKKALLAAATLVTVLVASGLVMFVRNPAPVVPAIQADSVAADSSKPFVVKLHAQWCPVCMVTKDVWSQIEAAYGSRVHLVVLDFTNQARTDASRVAVWGNLGILKLRRRDRPGALECFEKVLEIRPDDVRAREAIERLRRP